MGPNQGTLPAFVWRDQEKSRRTSASIADVAPEIRNEHTQNTYPEPYLQSNLFGTAWAIRTFRQFDNSNFEH
jgi:hypothetical protein